MLLRIGSVFCLLISYSLVYTASVLRRRGPSELLAHYTAKVKTAIFVIYSIQANNASSSCADVGLSENFDASGYDGEYAQRLLCETAIGIQLFSNLQQASSDMQNALDGLNDLHSDGASLSHLSSCQNLNVDALNEAGLDGPSIRQVIYNIPSVTSSESTTTTSNDTSNSSPSAQQPPTALVSTTVSLQSITGSPTRNDAFTATSISPTLPGRFNTSPLSSTSARVTESISAARSMSESDCLVGNTSQSASSSINESTIPVVTVTNFTTTWVTETALPSHSTMRTGNGATTTLTITSASTIEVTITVTDRDSSFTLEPIPPLRRRAWKWHRP